MSFLKPSVHRREGPCGKYSIKWSATAMRKFYSSAKQLAVKLDQEIAIRILCLFVR
jgi:hypothetical protein